MRASNSQSKRLLRWTLSGLLTLITLLCVIWALVPGAALITIGVLPVAAAFVIFVVGDQRQQRWLAILGLVGIVLGLGAGAALMVIVQGLGQ